jgi:hypothetical protein
MFQIIAVVIYGFIGKFQEKGRDFLSWILLNARQYYFFRSSQAKIFFVRLFKIFATLRYTQAVLAYSFAVITHHGFKMSQDLMLL